MNGHVRAKVSEFLKIAHRLLNTLERSIIKLFYYLIFSLGATIFFGAMNHYLQRKDYLYLGGVCFPVLAVLFGFTSLLYNRSRALQPGPVQRRSLYAAERSFQATLLFVVAIASGAIIATITEALSIDTSNTTKTPSTLLIYFIPILLALNSFSAFFFALRAAVHRTVKPISTRTLARTFR